MDRLKLPLGKMTKLGKPYLIDAPMASELNGAFAFLIKNKVPGAVGDPRLEQPQQFLIAYSPICTHMGCVIIRDEEDVVYSNDSVPESLTCGPCPCHGTTFDLLKAGLVVLGPATQNLSQLELESDGDEVFAIGWLASVDPRFENWPA